MKAFRFEMTPRTGIARAPLPGRMAAPDLAHAVAAAIGLMAREGERIRTVSLLGEEAESVIRISGVTGTATSGRGEGERPSAAAERSESSGEGLDGKSPRPAARRVKAKLKKKKVKIWRARKK